MNTGTQQTMNTQKKTNPFDVPETLEIIKTIRLQLGDRDFYTYIRARDFRVDYNDCSLNFNVGNGGTTNKNGGPLNNIQNCKISYNYGVDAYNMYFYDSSKNIVKEYTEIYCDQLQELFLDATGFFSEIE